MINYLQEGKQRQSLLVGYIVSIADSEGLAVFKVNDLREKIGGLTSYECAKTLNELSAKGLIKEIEQGKKNGTVIQIIKKSEMQEDNIEKKTNYFYEALFEKFKDLDEEKKIFAKRTMTATAELIVKNIDDLASGEKRISVVGAYQKKSERKANEELTEKIKNIFSAHYSAQVKKTTGHEVKFNFTDEDTEIIRERLLILIRLEINTNLNPEEVTVEMFWDMYLQKMPEWWKENHFTIKGIAKNFKQILNQIIFKNGEQQRKRSSKHKPTIDDVCAHIETGD